MENLTWSGFLRRRWVDTEGWVTWGQSLIPGRGDSRRKQGTRSRRKPMGWGPSTAVEYNEKPSGALNPSASQLPCLLKRMLIPLDSQACLQNQMREWRWRPVCVWQTVGTLTTGSSWRTLALRKGFPATDGGGWKKMLVLPASRKLARRDLWVYTQPSVAPWAARQPSILNVDFTRMLLTALV